MTKTRKRTTRVMLALLATPLVTVTLLGMLLYLPPIQRWAVRQAADYLSAQTGVDVTVGSARLAFPLDLSLGDVHAVQDGDTLLVVGRLLVDLDLGRLLHMSVGVDAVELSGVRAHTGQWIPSVSIDGKIGLLHLDADAVSVREHRVHAATALLHDSDIEVTLRGSSGEEDTTTSATPLWSIGIRKAEVCNSRLLVRLPGDSMRIGAGVGRAVLRNGTADLRRGTYTAQDFTLRADSALYDLPHTPPLGTGGIDPSHIRLDNIGLRAERIRLRQSPLLLECDLAQGQARERCGLRLDSLAAQVRCTGKGLTLSRLRMATPASRVASDLHMDYSAFAPHTDGQLGLRIRGHIAMRDIVAATGSLVPEDARRAFSSLGAHFRLDASGNMDAMHVDTLALTVPSVADLRAKGHLAHLLSADSLAGRVMWDMRTMNLSCVRRWLGAREARLPATTLHAATEMRTGGHLSVDALMTQGRGRARMTLLAHTRDMAYRLKLGIRGWRLEDWLPQSGLHHLTAQVSARGRGTDFLSDRTSMEGQVCIDSIGYRTWRLGNMGMDARLHKGAGQVRVTSGNQLLDMLALAKVRLRGRKLESSTFSMELNSIDLHALRLAKDTMRASMKMRVEGRSDQRQTHAMDAQADHITLSLKDTTFHPVNLGARLRLAPDSILAMVSAGDLQMDVRSPHGLDSLTLYGKRLLREIHTQADSLHIDQERLRALLPTLQVHLMCGTRNPVNNILRSASGYSFDRLNIDLDTSPGTGLRGSGRLYTLSTGAILLDTIQWDIAQDHEGVALKSRISNGQKNRVVSFQSTLQARLTATGATIHLDFIDAKGKKGVDMGLEANVTPDGVRAHMTPLNPIIAYRRFTLNKDNYVEVSGQGRLLAKVSLLADDGTGLKFYSTPNEDALQDLSLSMNNINMAELTSVMPYAPRLGGLLHGDVHYMQADSATTVSAGIGIRGMTYEDTPMGDMGLQAAYFPNSDGSHHVDAALTQDEKEIATLAGTYLPQEDEGRMEAEATLESLPLSLANAFLPQGTVSLSGAASGQVSVTGQASNPILTGTLTTESMHVTAEDYNIDLSIPDDTLRIKGSRLDLDHIKAYAAGNSPLTLNGSLDFSDLQRVGLSLDIAAKDYKLIDAPQSHTALAYGKVYVDMNARAWGTLDNLRVRGRLAVLGNTDVTYVLRDSPVTVHDQLSDIVTFGDFSDTTQVKPTQRRGQSVDAVLLFSVEEAAQVHCLLSEDGSDYINLQGGGELTLTYDPENDLRLYGRYTIGQGVMRYSIMAIPLNDFRIQSGSYVEFTGDTGNPTLAISASERVKASVTENSVPRNVAFDVGLSLSQTLADMGLTFTLEAPEDMTVQNELSAMSPEERGRVAVTMLVTGMYMTEGFNVKNGFSYANTLNAYLQSAINNIAGQALSTIDVSFGIENSTTATGGTTTDYSFSFRKRFWGNRISLVVGGKVSSGSEAQNNGQTIIDNVSLEYMLDNGASRYVRLYYDRNYQSMIEGELTEMGAALVLRRRTNRLRDLFRFGKPATGIPVPRHPQQPDTPQATTRDTTTTYRKTP